MSQVFATSVPPPFLRKTYELVEDPCTDPVISWNETGSAFVVWKTAEFSRDLLPVYFKHNNFSSFVRQLNTYGFRKVVPERWEFSHEGFKRGEIKALGEIRRRRSIQVIPPQITLAEKSILGPSSHSNSSSSNMKSTSTTSLNVKDNVVDRTAEVILWNENEKLRKDNERLNSELSCTKRQCEDLMVFFSKQVKVAPEQINELILQGVCGPTSDHKPITSCERLVCVNHDNDNKQVVNKKKNQNDEKLNLQLFGVWLKVEKREVDDNSSVNQASKKLKIVEDYTVPWMKISSGESNRVCN